MTKQEYRRKYINGFHNKIWFNLTHKNWNQYTNFGRFWYRDLPDNWGFYLVCAVSFVLVAMFFVGLFICEG